MVYFSLPSVPVSGAILDIVRVSERRNTASGISGLLLYGERRFFQVIEGAAAAVEEAFARIRADPRHRVLWHLVADPAARAIAPTLPMGYLSGAEARRAGTGAGRGALVAPSPGTAAAAVAALLDLGAVKYPSAVRVPVGQV